jgi:hypothetical protein
MAGSKVIAFFLPLNLVFVINYHKLAFQKKHNCIFILFQLLTMEHVLRINFMVKNKIISHLFDLILFVLPRINHRKEFFLLYMTYFILLLQKEK